MKKTDNIYPALALHAATRNQGPKAATFRSAEELESLLLEAGPARPMTPARKARIYGKLTR